MSNIPFHIEVRHFAEKIVSRVKEDYAIACEHVHSCCVLIAKKSFRIDGKWRTWIDYDKFLKLLEEGGKFEPEDYTAETPEWAVVGAAEEGFDPKEKRFYRKKKEKSERLLNELTKAKKRIESDPL
ncbi:hypothetical protein MHBO_002425 [Bonamia ostreae]|uniref:tRNA wybutosine-synthesis domain-containing protein n=1 Tax=Bonamia ostreae TaxID=126728 RepID=A0ABV2AMV3_9EUKA